jgi:hypothetical protein
LQITQKFYTKDFEIKDLSGFVNTRPVEIKMELGTFYRFQR